METNEAAKSGIHDLAREYVAASDQVADIERALKDAKAKRESVERALLDDMIAEGVPSLEIVSDRGKRAKVYPRSQLWARRAAAISDEDFVAAVSASPLAPLVRAKVNTNSLSAAIREMAEREGLKDSGPSAIREAIEREFPGLGEKIDISTTPRLNLRQTEAK